MIQELLGASSCLNFGGETKISVNGTILQGTPTSSSLSPSPSSSPATSSNPENHQNLRCPRCDSSNTKFCYYNNYNLTQPRHFCKTCRRYWTKGGALRNVPIGGGCRKNKSGAGVVSTSSLGKSTCFSKMKTVDSEIGRSGFDHELQSTTPILWTTTAPQSSHLLSLLRTTHKPNPLSNPVGTKEEVSLLGSQVMNEPTTVATAALNARNLGLDLVNPFWKSNQQQQQQQNNNNGFLAGEVQNEGVQQLYQRLKPSSPSTYYSNTSAVILSNVASSSSSLSLSPSPMLESAPVEGGELGYWNPAFSSSWSDLPTTNGAYP